MTPEQISEVWTMLDRDKLAAIARRGYDPVFATVSGAHLYGFASKDSDVDLRGAFLIPVLELLGFELPAETQTIEDKTEIDLDFVAHDLRKFARMLAQGNGYVLEQLYSPLVVIETPAFHELRRLATACVTLPTLRHFLGFANSRRDRLTAPNPTVKHLLYAYRVLFTGLHLAQSGVIESHLPVLNEVMRDAVVNELMERKRAGAEKGPLEAREIGSHVIRVGKLIERLENAIQDSALPVQTPATCIAELEHLIVATRLRAGTTGLIAALRACPVDDFDIEQERSPMPVRDVEL